MATHHLFPSRRTLRFLSGLFILLLALGALPWTATVLIAQAPGQKKGAEEEEDKSKKKPVVGKEEVEESAVKKPRRKVIVDDDDKPGKAPAKAPLVRPVDDGPADVAAALKATKNRDLQELYNELAVPHDVLVLHTRTSPFYNIEPVKTYYPGENPRFRANLLEVRLFNAEWKPIPGFTVRSAGVLRITPYELHACEVVDTFRTKKLEQFAEGTRRYLSVSGQLQAAALVLAAAESFHLSALERGIREGENWEDVGRRLHKKLLGVRLEQLALFVGDNDWDGAADHARRLAEGYPDPEERDQIASLLIRLIEHGLASGSEDRYKVARDRLHLLERYFPGSRTAGGVASKLRQQSVALFTRGQELLKANKLEEATRVMSLAEDIYPRLEGLGDELRRLKGVYPVLRLGVRSLPVNLLPGLSTTDEERQAVELMFEGLVRLREEPGVGTRYEPDLAAAMPRLVALGREFRLARNAFWSNGEPVSAADVDATVRLLNDPKWQGAVPTLGKLLAEKVDLGGDVFRVSLNLKQGYLDPLALMTFKVMPRDVEQQVMKFNREAPVGSGPYRYGGPPKSLEGRNTIRFYANPHYATREGRFGRPRIREIQFVEYNAGRGEEPTDGLVKGDGNREGVHLVANVPAQRARELKTQHVGTVTVVGPLKTRRVWFLAINHRRRPLGNSAELRRALAYAIDREVLLDQHFRGGYERKEVHQALNGPFPAGSWASSPLVPENLHLPDRAKGLIANVGPTPRMTLKYPSGDAAVEGAMKALCEQVKTEIGVDLQPQPVEPQKLREDVELNHQYDLAYYHYDYISEAYWLGPLFDPEGDRPGGTNYLGFIDSGLMAALGLSTIHRDFAAVREKMQSLHGLTNLKMPFLPLWQLDRFIAYRKELKPTGLDPLLGFSDVEHWTKEAK